MKSTILTTATVLFLLVAIGCAGPKRPAWLSINPNNWANRDIKDEPVLLQVVGPVEVIVESFSGDVFIEGVPELVEAQVIVVREAVHGYSRVDEAIASLEQIQYDIQIVPGELGQAIRVQTSTAHAEPHFQRTHVHIQAPDVENITVRTTNGKVWVQNVRGRVDITTSEQDVRVATNQAMTREVTIVNRNGDIEYRVRGESQGRIDAETVNGRANGFARFGRMVVEPTTRSHRFHATLNRGNNPITLRTVNGDIYVAVVHNPELVDRRPIP